jgi:hypothetical protein
MAGRGPGRGHPAIQDGLPPSLGPDSRVKGEGEEAVLTLYLLEIKKYSWIIHFLEQEC